MRSREDPALHWHEPPHFVGLQETGQSKCGLLRLNRFSCRFYEVSIGEVMQDV